MKHLFYLIFLIFSLNCFSQNIVPNPGFEQFTICPDNDSQISRSQFWSSYGETPDYFNNCSTVSGIFPPNCYTGFQYPHSGNAFAGFYTFVSFALNNREIIGSQLLTPLVIGQKYFISFFVNLGGNINLGTTIASNKIGIKFSTVPYSESNPVPINDTSHFYCNNIVTDTAKWTKISGSYIADSAYSYINIGNFFKDSLTDTLNLSTNNIWAYYNIDDVCVSPDSLFCENWMGVNEQIENKKEEITIYPNPCTTQITMQYNILPNEPATLSLLDITGKTLMQITTTENEHTFNTEKLAKGLYLVKVETEGRVVLQKVMKE